MGLAEIVSKTDPSIGRAKTDAPAVTSTAELIAVMATGDLDYTVPAAEYERLKTALIATQEAVGLGDGTTVGSLEARAQAGLQGAYEADSSIVVTTAEGALALSNTADVTDLLSLSRTFAGAGDGIDITMGAGTTGDAIRAAVQSGQDALTVTDGTNTLTARANRIELSAGIVRAPFFALDADDTGIDGVDADTFDLVASGVSVARVQAPAGANPQIVALATSPANKPLVALDIDGNSGIHSTAGNLVEFSTDQTTKLTIGTSAAQFKLVNVWPGANKTLDLGDATLYWNNGYIAKVFADEISSVQYKEKIADETIVSSDTLQDDNHLVVTLTAGGRYTFRFGIFITVESATPGFKFGLGGTAGATSFKSMAFVWDSTGALIAASRDTVTGVAMAIGDGYAVLEGSIEVSTGGTLLLSWAQNTNSADDTIVQRNSFVEVIRCG